MDIVFELILFIAIFIGVLISSCFRKVREDQRYAHYRIAKYMGLKGPGLIILIPIIDRVTKVSLGEQGELLEHDYAIFEDGGTHVESNEILDKGLKVKVTGFLHDKVQVIRDES